MSSWGLGCFECNNGPPSKEDRLYAQFKMLCEGQNTLDHEKLPVLLESIYDHEFSEGECQLYVNRTASFTFHKIAAKKDANGDLVKPRLYWEEVEYIVDLCERRYPLLSSGEDKAGLNCLTAQARACAAPGSV